MVPSEPIPLSARVGQRIRMLRRAQQLSAEALAERLHWPKDTLINYEYGRRALTLDRLEQIATALELSPVALLVSDARLILLIEQLTHDPGLIDHITFFLDSLAAELRVDPHAHP